MIERIKEELELLKDGMKVVIKLILYLVTFIIFVAVMSYIWVKNTTEMYRQNNESIEDTVAIIIPLILTGFVIRYVEAKLKDK